MPLNPENQTMAQSITQLQIKITQLLNDLQTKDEQIQTLNHTVAELKKQIETHVQESFELQKLIQVKEKEILEAGTLNFSKDNLLEQRETEIQTFKHEIAQLKLKLSNVTGNPKFLQGIESTEGHQQMSTSLGGKSSEGHSQDLERLKQENKRLSDQNLRLSSELQQLSSDQFLRKISKKPLDQTELKQQKKNDASSLSQAKKETPQHNLDPETRQEESNQQAPKKRKLMRKPRIEVDVDTFGVSPVNI